MNKSVRFEGAESPDALLSNGQLGHRLYGYPRIGAQQMMLWIADWVRRGGSSLGKPTHFENPRWEILMDEEDRRQKTEGGRVGSALSGPVMAFRMDDRTSPGSASRLSHPSSSSCSDERAEAR